MKTLYGYQWDAVLDLSDWATSGEQKLALVMPTGAGKSLVISCLLERISGMFVSAVVATPLNTIKNAFEEIEDEVAAKALEAPGTTSNVTFNLAGMYHASGVAADAPSTFKSHLKAKSPAKFGLVVSHQGLVRWFAGGSPKDLTGRILVIDEAHHADMTESDATELGKVTDAWVARGGVVLLVTATPFRGNGIALFDEAEGWKVHTRNLVEHAASLEIQFPLERFALTSRAEKTSELDGRDVPFTDQERLAEEWAQKWDADGQPKAVFIVPARASKEWGEGLVARLQAVAPKVRVHNAVGVSVQKQKELNALLASERNVTRYEDSKVDVIIACRRFNEGTDWKLASHVYNYGLPSSYGLILQRWGRAFRDKRGIGGYPEIFRNTAKIVFLVPSAAQEVALDFEKKTHNMHSLVLCFMDNFKTASQFVGSRKLEPKTLDEVRDEQKKKIADFKQMTARQLTVEYEVSVLADEERPPTMGEWKTWVDTECPVELRAAARSVLGTKLRVRMPRGVRSVVDDHGEFFEQVVNDPEFRDLTFAPNEGIIAAETEFTGEKVKELSRRLNVETVSLAEAFPEIAAQWHPTKNGTLTPMGVARAANFKVWWQCAVNGDHVWHASPLSRTIGGTGCRYCAGRLHSLADTSPDIARLWHPTKNGRLNPNNITAKSVRKVWWQCGIYAEHVWHGAPLRTTGCPVCATSQRSLVVVAPTIAKEWHPTKNRGLTPLQVTYGSNRKVWWQCPVNKRHQWEATVANRTGSSGRCPSCGNRKATTYNSLYTTHRALVNSMWDCEKNEIQPTEVTSGSNRIVWWRCSNGHAWEEQIASRVLGSVFRQRGRGNGQVLRALGLRCRHCSPQYKKVEVVK